MSFEELQKIIDEFKNLPFVEYKPSFLEIARFPHRETVWRNILAFFLNPNECHGLKDLALRSLFDAIGQTNQDIGDFKNIKIYTECQTSSEKFLDLMIYGGEYVVGVEVKVHAALYNDLEDYAKYIQSEAPNKQVHKIVLSLHPCKPCAEFVNLLWSDLTSAIQSRMGEYLFAADSKYTTLLVDFFGYISQFQGGHDMTDNQELFKFLKKNREGVKKIIAEHEKVFNILDDNMGQTHDKLLDFLKEKGVKITDPVQRLFTWRGLRLSKFGVVTNEGRFVLHLQRTEDYQIEAHINFNATDITSRWAPKFKSYLADKDVFDVSKTSADEITEKVGNAIVRMVEYINNSIAGQNA